MLKLLHSKKWNPSTCYSHSLWAVVVLTACCCKFSTFSLHTDSFCCEWYMLREKQYQRSLINLLCSYNTVGRLQAGHSRLQFAARSSSIVPGWRLPADHGLRMPPASLRSCQRPHCSENKHSTWRQEFSVAGLRIWNSLPASLRQPDIEFWHFKRLLKAFLFGETVAH